MSERIENLAQLSSLVDMSDRPVYALDQHRQIVYCSRALTDWLQVEPSQVIGRRVEYHSEPEDGSSSGGVSPAVPLTDLCPPPQVFTGVETTATVSCVHRDGRLVHRRARFVPLTLDVKHSSPVGLSGKGAVGTGVLAILETADLTPTELSQALAVEPLADELHREIRRFRHSQIGRYAPDTLLGQSPAMRKVRAQVQAAARSGANVLILGRPGTDLKRVGKSIHYAASGRDALPLVTLDANLVNDDLLRRSFDSLTRTCDSQHGGTLLISDIHELTRELQLEIVRRLDDRTLNVRLIGTGHDDGARRQDAGESSDGNQDADQESTLDVRLESLVSTIVIRVPALVERLEDLPLLVQFLLEARNQGQAKQVGGVSVEVLENLSLYGWPGGLKELQDVIGHAHDRCQGHEIVGANLPPLVHHAVQAALSQRNKVETIVLDELLAQIERQLIERAMDLASGNKTEAARLLGVTRPRLYRRLVQLGWKADGKGDGPS